MAKVVFEIEGIIPSKKNSKTMIVRGNKPRLISSKAYKDWEEEQLWRLASRSSQIKPIDTPCTIHVQFQSKHKRKWDLSNKFESIADLLVKAGILTDDNWSVLEHVQLDFSPTFQQDLAIITLTYER